MTKQIDLWFDQQKDTSYTTVCLAAKIFGNQAMFDYWNDPEAKYHW